MNEVGYNSMSAASFNQDNISKLFSDTFSRIPETTFSSANNYTIADVETKEIVNLRRSVNRLEKNISFIQHEHNQMLNDLQNQVDKLREENQDLQFQLVMRSSRTTDDLSQIQINPLSSEFHKPIPVEPESVSTQILQLKLALNEEKAINNELMRKLNSFATAKFEMNSNNEEIQISQNRTGDEIDISSKIRISFDPLTLSLYHEDSGQYIKNTNPSREDCEVIIKTLLEKPRQLSTHGSSESSIQSLNTKTNIVIPIIRKPLQIIKQYPRNSASIKLNPLHGTICSKPIELLSNHQKLMPIMAHRGHMPNLEDVSQRSDINKQSDREYQQRPVHSSMGDKNIGSSLPALPKPNERNQADKQRRLQLIQKNRLDQFNSKH